MLPVAVRREPPAATRAPARGSARAPHPPAGDAGDAALAAQQRDFDRMMRVRAELDRESNALREMALAQAKRDDEEMRAWIRLI